MQLKGVTAARTWRSALAAIAAFALAVMMTWPLARDLGSLGRTGAAGEGPAHFGTNGDGMFSLWNVAWVARTIVADPENLFQANIFYPHRDALAYSEANIIAGVVGIPAWWTTKNPYATLNVVILVAFASAWFCMWKLALYLTGNAIVAATAASFFAFCPYVFAHTAHIQLMITGGIPLAMLMLHHIADSPTWQRGAGLGFTLLVQALACAYYGIFAALMVGFAVVFFTISRSLARNSAWWAAIAVGAVVSVAGVLPFLYPYFELRRDAGFERSLQDSVRYSANLTSYLASSAYAHQGLLERISGWPRWTEVMFPGFLPLTLAAVGVTLATRSRDAARTRDGETVLLYGAIGILAFWASFGPAAGLYSLLFHTVPVFSFLRAPSRMAIVVVLCLAVLASIGLRHLLNLVPHRGRTLTATLITAVAIAELATAMPWEKALIVPDVYNAAAKLPKGPLAEFPFYGGRSAWHLHTQYMLFSTTHWMPMLNGYSDHTPPQFRQDSVVLDGFPSDDSFAVLQKARVRYVGVHWDMFGPRAGEIRTRLQPYRPHLSLLAESPRMSFYEIVSFP